MISFKILLYREFGCTKVSHLHGIELNKIEIRLTKADVHDRRQVKDLPFY